MSIGSHIRRMNVEISRYHRSWTETDHSGEEVLMDPSSRWCSEMEPIAEFAVFAGCADISRQFEFWFRCGRMTLSSANWMNHDPFAGMQDGSYGMTFRKDRSKRKLKGLPAFTTVRGAHFFLPDKGIKNLICWNKNHRFYFTAHEINNNKKWTQVVNLRQD